nr:hypothetical protein [Acidovorax sp. KKS102]
MLAHQAIAAPVVVVDLAAARTAAGLQAGIAQPALQQAGEGKVAARLAAHIGRFAFFQHLLHPFKVLFTHQRTVALHLDPVLWRVRRALVGTVEDGPARIHLVLEDVGQRVLAERLPAQSQPRAIQVQGNRFGPAALQRHRENLPHRVGFCGVLPQPFPLAIGDDDIAKRHAPPQKVAILGSLEHRAAGVTGDLARVALIDHRANGIDKPAVIRANVHLCAGVNQPRVVPLQHRLVVPSVEVVAGEPAG